LATKPVETKIDGKILSLSNLDKVLYREVGFTKAQVIDYYARIGPVMLPHLKNRALTLKRYPEGVDSPYFYEKECPGYRPEWMDTVTIESRNERGQTNYCVVDDLPSLVWVANLASLEMHTLLSLKKDLDRPTFVAFDLDPGTGIDTLDCAWGALELKKIVDSLGLECFPKTSGGKGIHVYIPLNTKVNFDETKAFAKGVAVTLERTNGKKVTSNMRKVLRNGKIFVDWSQNDRHKTTVCAYSLRARPKPTVSTPLEWGELTRARKKGDPDALVFVAEDVLKRVEKKGDLFEPVLKLKQKLPPPPA